jgi:hypothetical protein
MSPSSVHPGFYGHHRLLLTPNDGLLKGILAYPSVRELPVYSAIGEAVDSIPLCCRLQPALGLILGFGPGTHAEPFQDRANRLVSLPLFPIRNSIEPWSLRVFDVNGLDRNDSRTPELKNFEFCF